MTHPSLTLCPANPDWLPPDDKRLEDFLQSLQFTGKTFNQAGHYLAGEKFLDLIAFMGCSPQIQLDPGEDDGSFCYIQLHQQTPAIEFRSGDHTHNPRCPLCRKPVDDWKRRIRTWLDNDTTALWQCDACKTEAAPWKYNWRKSAGFGRCFIIIRNIFPKEAIPQRQLLDTLNSHYGIEWHYFYEY